MFPQEMPLSGKILTDGVNFSLAPNTEAKLKEAFTTITKMTEDEYERNLAINLAFITAAEIALMASIDEYGSLRLPALISPREILIGFLKCDTIDGRKCRTLSRIKEGVVWPSDFFTFTADLDKIGMVSPTWDIAFLFKMHPNISEFLHSYLKYRRDVREDSLTFKVLQTKYPRIETFLWFLRASFVTKKDPKEIEEQSNELARNLEIR